MNGNSCFQLLKEDNSMWRWQLNGIRSPQPLRCLVDTAGKIKNQRTFLRNCLHARRPVALSRHADEKCRSLTWADLLQAAALQCGAGGPLVGTGSFDAPQLGEDSCIRIQNFNAVGNTVGGLFQDEAQEVAAR